MKGINHIKRLIAELDGQVAPSRFSEEELIPTFDAEDEGNRTVEIESTGSVYKNQINETEDRSEFLFFEDGKQRTVQIGHIPLSDGGEIRIIPVHYYAIGSVILKRENKKLSTWNSPLLEEGIILHKKLIRNTSKVEQIERQGILVLDTSDYDSTSDSENDYYSLKRWALRAAKKRRLQIEQQLIEKWNLSEDTQSSFLVVDGSLINIRGEENLKWCLGVSKSSRMKMDNFDKVMQLKEYERSWTFSFHGDENDNKSSGVRDRVSWYLRIRDKTNSDPEFGLIRPELHWSHKDNAPDLANRFSKSLILERLPTAYPTNNWDKTLYPIAVCANYLSSIMPSARSIKATMSI